MKESTTLSATTAFEGQTAVQRLVSLATRGLVPMFDRDKQLFCYSLQKGDYGMVQEGISQRYTMMTLMGLHRLEEAGGKSPIEIKPVVRRLFENLLWVEDIGDLGVLMWMCSQIAPDHLEKIEQRIDLGSALERYPSARRGVTMELAWFLTGLSYWAAISPKHLPQLRDIALKTYARLQANRGEQSAFYGHLSTTSSLAGRIRGRIGSFADQVYPMYAMTKFAQVYQHDEAAVRALAVGRGLCDAQGPLGQWWWHYDSYTGRVVDGYPVFSVHQHAMGPMTLFALGEAFNADFSSWIFKGLEWINSANELKFDMEDPGAGVVWRCIFRSRRSLARYLQFGASSQSIQEDKPEELKVLRECRPYELGWMLYAFAQRGGVNSSMEYIAFPRTEVSSQALRRG